jgi:hypothetical protein
VVKINGIRLFAKPSQFVHYHIKIIKKKIKAFLCFDK